MEYKTQEEYWRKYGILTGDVFFRIDSLLEEVLDSDMGGLEFAERYSELTREYAARNKAMIEISMGCLN